MLAKGNSTYATQNALFTPKLVQPTMHQPLSNATRHVHGILNIMNHNLGRTLSSTSQTQSKLFVEASSLFRLYLLLC
jgi:hypothetical protein